MLWLALHLPALPLEALVCGAASLPEDRPTPAAVIDRRQLVAVNEAALAQGVHPGMSLAAATSLLPELQRLERQPPCEAELVERLTLALARYTPSIVRLADGVLLEVQASRRLFGGARALLREARATVASSGVSRAAWAAAHTATAAALMARVPRRASPEPRRRTHAPRGKGGASTNERDLCERTLQHLDALPLPEVLAAWQTNPTLMNLLQGIGCRSLGDARALPRTGFKRRGGATLLDLMDRAYGDAADPQDWYQPPPHFEQRIELLHRVDDAAALVFAAQRLVQPLVGWLAQQWRAATRLSLRIAHETQNRRAQADTVLTLDMGEPTREAAQITMLLRERLQRLILPAPAQALRLVLDESVPHAGRATSFWRQAQSQHESERVLIDRLMARLGSQGVHRAACRADHRPERALQWEHPHAQDRAEAMHGTKVKTSAATEPQRPSAPRPTWLLAEPRPLDEAAGRPMHAGAPLALLTRAERIEAGWFDGALVRRDYHVALMTEGDDRRCLWIFHEHRPDAAPRWFLHGCFG